MEFKSILKPQGSVTMGLATGILVYAIYDRSLPDAATMGATKAYDVNIEQGRKKAGYTAAASLAAVTLLTKDVNVFILGGMVLIALDIHARHANVTNPATGSLVQPEDSQPVSGGGAYGGTGAPLSAVS
jgi:hypothetical protein